jgi:hypothetical protein
MNTTMIIKPQQQKWTIRTREALFLRGNWLLLLFEHFGMHDGAFFFIPMGIDQYSRLISPA